MKEIKYSILIIIGLFIYTINAFAHEYYPNVVGNRWVLKSPTSEEHLIRIARKEMLQGQAVNVLQRQSQGRVDNLFIATFSDGIRVFRSTVNIGIVGLLTFDYVPPEVLIPSPLEVGTTWEVLGRTTLNQVVITAKTFSTVVAAEDVTVPAGMFKNCLKIRQEHVLELPLRISVTGYIWLAKHIGLVKEINTNGVIFELVEYELFYPWDVNGDMKVDILDLLIVSNHFGEHISIKTSNNNPDINGDGSVDISDLVLVGIHFGEAYSSVGAAPALIKLDLPVHACLCVAPVCRAGTGRRRQVRTQTGWRKQNIDYSRYFEKLKKIYAEFEKSSNNSAEVVQTKLLLQELIAKAKREVLPTETKLYQNYPNPFNPETWIPYQLALDADVAISIYNTKGQLIRRLNLGRKDGGVYVTKNRAAYWDGKDNMGFKVASGVYFYTMLSGDGDFTATQKMIFLK